LSASRRQFDGLRKGINFVLTNGGNMKDYWGYGKALRSMLPMIAVRRRPEPAAKRRATR